MFSHIMIGSNDIAGRACRRSPGGPEGGPITDSRSTNAAAPFGRCCKPRHAIDQERMRFRERASVSTCKTWPRISPW